MKFCLIYNQSASSQNQFGFVKKIYEEILKKHSIDFFKTRTEQEASDIINELKKNKYDRLILAGGDGTVSFAINELFKNNLELKESFALGYIPVGTANILKSELKIKKEINFLVKTLTSNNIKKANVVKINNNFFLLMASSGWDAQIIQSVKSPIKKILGKLIFVLKGLQKMILMKNNKFTVLLNGEKIDADWVICCNSKYYAGHYSINNSNIFENKIITFIIKDLTRIKLFYLIYIIIFYGDLSIAKGVISSSLQSVSFEKKYVNIPIQVDGNYLGSFDRVDIESVDKKINLISG